MPARTADEWIVVAKIAKDIKTIFVEGVSDARILTALTGYRQEVDVRSADEISVEIQGCAFLGGNRLKVSEVGRRALDQNVRNIRCMIDKDFEDLYHTRLEDDFLIKTDFSNLIVGTFTFEWLRNVLLKGYGYLLTVVEWQQVISCLQWTFFCRYTMQRDNIGSAPSIGDFLNVEGGCIVLRKERYVNQRRGVQHTSDLTRNIVARVDDFCGHFQDDHRHYVNSTDLFDAIFWFLRRRRVIGGAHSRDAVRSILIAAESDFETEQPKLTELIEWARP